MKVSSLFRLVFAIAFLCLLTISAAAQAGFGSYTSIDYDEATNIVTAYSETDTDYELQGEYRAKVNLWVTNEYGTVVASGIGFDTFGSGDGVASVGLNFAGEAGRTYTAVGIHSVLAYYYDFDDYPPYEQFYYDDWYFTGFESQNIYEPSYFYFTSPAYNYFQRRTQTITLGRTYDSVSAMTGINRGYIQAQGADISRQDASRINGTTCSGNSGTVTIKGAYSNGTGEGTISWSWAGSNIPTKTQAFDALQCISNSLTPTQRNSRSQNAFPSAANYISSSSIDGRDAERIPRSWSDPGQPTSYRVDSWVIVGRAFSGVNQ